MYPCIRDQLEQWPPHGQLGFIYVPTKVSPSLEIPDILYLICQYILTCMENDSHSHRGVADLRGAWEVPGVGGGGASQKDNGPARCPVYLLWAGC